MEDIQSESIDANSPIFQKSPKADLHDARAATHFEELASRIVDCLNDDKTDELLCLNEELKLTKHELSLNSFTLKQTSAQLTALTQKYNKLSTEYMQLEKITRFLHIDTKQAGTIINDDVDEDGDLKQKIIAKIIPASILNLFQPMQNHSSVLDHETSASPSPTAVHSTPVIEPEAACNSASEVEHTFNGNTSRPEISNSLEQQMPCISADDVSTRAEPAPKVKTQNSTNSRHKKRKKAKKRHNKKHSIS